MSAQRILIDTARATVSGLRALANSLEFVLDRVDSEAPLPILESSSDPAGSNWAFVSEQAPLTPPATPARGSSGVVPPSPAPTNYSTNSYHEVAAELSRAPDFCFALCSRLALGSQPAIERRVQRAWEAGLWAKATIEGRIQKPRPTPKIDLQPVVYIIVRAPGLDHPVRVSTAAEYFSTTRRRRMPLRPLQFLFLPENRRRPSQRRRSPMPSLQISCQSCLKLCRQSCKSCRT